MPLKNRLDDDLKKALRENDENHKQVIRLILAGIKLAEIESKAELDDPGIVNIVQKEIKIRDESILGAERANRSDLAAQYRTESAILKTYLPEQLREEEIKSIACEIIEEFNATSMSDMGRVMKALLLRVQGRAPNEVRSKTVRELLSKS